VEKGRHIIEAVRGGRIQAVIVYMFDHWGRDGAEWLARAREFDRLGVPIISVQEGKDEGGLIRFVRAGMAEEYRRQLAKRVRPACEKAAHEGVHMGTTPYGYKRVYPAWDGKGRRPHGHLERDLATAWVVQELFTRYDTGAWSLVRLAHWLNDDPTVPAARRAERWSSNTVRGILRNAAYKGFVRYNKERRGLYDSAPPGSEFVAPGQHEPLVSPELFDRVQQRLGDARLRPSFTRLKAPLPLGARLLVCAACCSPMIPKRRRADGGRGGQYVCAARTHHRGCAEREYTFAVAHAALLAEVCRLQHRPWPDDAEQRLGGPADERAAEAAALRRALEQERETLRTYARRIATMAQDPTPEEMAEFATVRAEFTARIRSLEAQLAAVDQPGVDVEGLRALHERFRLTPPAAIVARLVAQKNEEALPELLHTLVERARVAGCEEGRYCRWVRLEVTWTPDVQLLLETGLLWLDAAPTCPERLTRAHRRRLARRQTGEAAGSAAAR
jgi:hypothetical protein